MIGAKQRGGARPSKSGGQLAGSPVSSSPRPGARSLRSSSNDTSPFRSPRDDRGAVKAVSRDPMLSPAAKELSRLARDSGSGEGLPGRGADDAGLCVRMQTWIVMEHLCPLGSLQVARLHSPSSLMALS